MSDGEVKFSVELENWPWSENGTLLEIEIIVKVPPGRTVARRNETRGRSDTGQRGRPDSFNLGMNASAYFSRKVSAHNQSINQSIFFTHQSEWKVGSESSEQVNKAVITARKT